MAKRQRLTEAERQEIVTELEADQDPAQHDEIVQQQAALDAQVVQEWEHRRRAHMAEFGAKRRVAREAGDLDQDAELAKAIRHIRAYGPDSAAADLESADEGFAERDQRASEVRKAIEAELAAMPPGPEAARAHELFGSPYAATRYALFPWDSTPGAPMRERITLEELLERLAAIDRNDRLDAKARDRQIVSTLADHGFLQRGKTAERDGLSWVGFLVLGCTPEDALRRVADRRGVDESATAQSLRRFFKDVGFPSPVTIPHR